jgi:hypothetical protein
VNVVRIRLVQPGHLVVRIGLYVSQITMGLQRLSSGGIDHLTGQVRHRFLHKGTMVLDLIAMDVQTVQRRQINVIRAHLVTVNLLLEHVILMGSRDQTAINHHNPLAHKQAVTWTVAEHPCLQVASTGMNVGAHRDSQLPIAQVPHVRQTDG